MSILAGHVMSFVSLIPVKMSSDHRETASKSNIHPGEQKGQMSREGNNSLVGIALYYGFQASGLARIRLPWAITFGKASEIPFKVM